MSDELDELLAEVDEEAEDLIDLTEAEDFEPLTGDFPVEVIAVKKGTSKDSGNPYYEGKLRVFEGEAKGRVVFKVFMLKGKGTGITKRYLTALGADIDWDAPKISPATILGLRGTATLAPDTRKGWEHKTVVNDIKPLTTSDDAEDLN